MADVEKINVGGQDLNICDATARASIPTNVSQLQNDSGYVNQSALPNIVSENPFAKITLSSSSTICLVYGSSFSTYNLAVPYGNGYLADFAITIPASCRPTNGFASMTAHAIITGSIVFAQITGYNNGVVTGYLWTPGASINTNIGIALQMIGY